MNEITALCKATGFLLLMVAASQNAAIALAGAIGLALLICEVTTDSEDAVKAAAKEKVTRFKKK
jgi:hypothetical protein